MRNALILFSLIASGCASAPQPSHVGGNLPSGRWGGDQVALEISADGSGRIEMSCATAEFAGPVKVDVGGHFLTDGRFARGTGVATREGPEWVPATISGRVDGRETLWLDIALRDSYPVRSARLTRNAEPNLLRCL
ncbi:hypothetical protein H9L13_02315 [Sphingomonas lutea]|uniref:Lipoprotein n=1 Tax=Sphingomonas lutea TaxID=1045317 RepID=A0A7G9SIW2_9SPHN|nr:hypothetical protein [Sphingomonas lutea]QNN67787.1 hypothetical protein H9L13_02315 [Sphingomonas lutea]